MMLLLYLTIALSSNAPNKKDKIKGAYFGALVADAMCLGSHYEYDAAVIKKAYGNKPISQYMGPGEQMGGSTHGVGWGRRNYHPGQKKGDNTDYGLYNEIVLEHVATENGFKLDNFIQKTWLPKMKGNGWGAWKCTQTKQALERIQSGDKSSEVGGHSNAMSLRTAPIFAAFPKEDDLGTINKDTMFTHANDDALAAGEFFTRVTYKVINGMTPRDAITEVGKEAKNSKSPILKRKANFINEQIKKGTAKFIEATDPAKPLGKQEFVDDLAMTSMARLWDVGKTEPIKVGKASPAEGTMPSSIYIILKYHEDPIAAFQANTMVGGDNAARSVPIGMVLGAYHGASAIPDQWKKGLNAWKRSEKLLDGLLSKQKDEL